jgi:hypothetical protein
MCVSLVCTKTRQMVRTNKRQLRTDKRQIE